VTSALAASSRVEPDVVLDVTRLHDEYADFVWRSLQRLGVRASSLEDALQDVFVVVHRRIDSYDGSSKVSTWLFGICLRVASAHRKRAYLKHETGQLESCEPVDDDPLADPEQTALRREAARRLEQGLEAMALDRRAVFVMFEIEGLPTAAIADILGIPKGTVHSRLHKARAEFMAALERQESTPKIGGLA
jgi:RNA polymerase sigma-70 factor (ECF subfamily)